MKTGKGIFGVLFATILASLFGGSFGYGAEWPLKVNILDGKGMVTVEREGRIKELVVDGVYLITNSSFCITMEEGGGQLVPSQEPNVTTEGKDTIISSEGEIRLITKEDPKGTKGFAKYKAKTTVSQDGKIRIRYEFEQLREDVAYKYGGIRILSILSLDSVKGRGFRAKIGEEDKVGVVPQEIPVELKNYQSKNMFDGNVKDFKLSTTKGSLEFVNNTNNHVSFYLQKIGTGGSVVLDLFDMPVYFSGIRETGMKTEIDFVLTAACLDKQ